MGRAGPLMGVTGDLDVTEDLSITGAGAALTTETSEAATDVIVQLDLAVLIFDRVRAVSWAARGRKELQACGGKSRTATSTALSTLTAQELRIVVRVASGATNREVATDLFLSSKTVENLLARNDPETTPGDVGVTS